MTRSTMILFGITLLAVGLGVISTLSASVDESSTRLVDVAARLNQRLETDASPTPVVMSYTNRLLENLEVSSGTAAFRMGEEPADIVEPPMDGENAEEEAERPRLAMPSISVQAIAVNPEKVKVNWAVTLPEIDNVVYANVESWLIIRVDKGSGDARIVDRVDGPGREFEDVGEALRGRQFEYLLIPEFEQAIGRRFPTVLAAPVVDLPRGWQVRVTGKGQLGHGEVVWGEFAWWTKGAWEFERFRIENGTELPGVEGAILRVNENKTGSLNLPDGGEIRVTDSFDLPLPDFEE